MGHDGDSARREFLDGVAAWRLRFRWPADFHNGLYRELSIDGREHELDMAWWSKALPHLNRWKATRGVPTREITQRFESACPALREAWRDCHKGSRQGGIAAVTWEEVSTLPNQVSLLKPTRQPSIVFTSKLCHFMLPNVFPVVDKAAVGSPFSSYREYFCYVQHDWSTLSAETASELQESLRRLIADAGNEPLARDYPFANKITELRLIGRRFTR